MNRILDATESLLEDRLFENLPLADILERARTSVGSFYARFDGKDALVPHLYQRYDAVLHRSAARLLKSDRWRARDLRYRTSRFARFVVKQYRRNRGLLRALALHARTNPNVLTPQQTSRRLELSDQVAGLFLDVRGEVRHPDPDLAVRHGVFFMLATCRDRILFSNAPHPSLLAGDDHTLSTELGRALLAYLSFAPESSRGDASPPDLRPRSRRSS